MDSETSKKSKAESVLDVNPGIAAEAKSATETKAQPENKREDKKVGSERKSAKNRNNVKQMRIKRMMSKAELARRANLSVLTVDRVEKGYGCRMDTKRKILEALGLSLDDRVQVFGEEE